GAVKTEFGKFGEVLAKAKDHIDRAGSTLVSASVRTRAIERRLRDVESLPDARSAELLEDNGAAESGAESGAVASAGTGTAPDANAAR
ncbi:MAG: DNA recombination protein RmuC, partial [Burkholderiaceae bacterium]|nr:DNA recombination protein RmuC [Burkholderiaceae bacterium]